METVKKKIYKHFIGIDVSRNTLDFAIMEKETFLFHQVIENNKEKIDWFIDQLKTLHNIKIGKSIFCMENTGIYCHHLLFCFSRVKASVVLENPLHIKNSLGAARGKNDKTDSIRIANYLYKSRDEVRLWEKRRPIVEKLAKLSALRSRLIAMQKGLSTMLNEQSKFETNVIVKRNKKLSSATLLAMKNDIKAIDEELSDLIKSDSILKRLMDVITSVPCFGPVTALQIIISTNEYKDIRNPKKFACYAGVAPFVNSSGTVVKKSRVSKIANKKIKALLHICSLTAISYPGELQNYYKRKTELEGKHKMAVINAIRNKLILRVFACLSQNRLYEPNYKRVVIT